MEHDTNMPTENTMQPPSLERSSSRYKNTIIGAAAVFVFVAVCFGAWLIQSRMQSGAVSADFAPTGTLYFSMKPIEVPEVNIYSFDISAGVLTKIIGSGGMNTTPTLAPSGLMYVSNEYGDGRYLKVPQIFEKFASGSTTQITDTTAVMKRHPSYVPGYRTVVYDGRPSLDQKASSAPDVSTVYVRTSKTSGGGISSGALPWATPDGKSVVFLKNDGLYLGSVLGSTTPEKIWAPEGTVTTNDTFSVSQDGSYIVWTHPGEGHILLMRVASWYPFVGHVVNDFVAHGLWPVISPDNAYIAYEGVTMQNGLPTDGNLTIQSIETGVKKVVQLLDTFDPGVVALTAWAK